MNRIEITKQENACWGYAYVRPRAEKKIAERLQGDGILCYVPTVPHAYMMHYTKVITHIPMFPCYLFLCMNREDATSLRYAEKQIRKIDLQFDELKEDLLIRELQALQQCEIYAQSQPVYVNPGIREGDKVLIKDGPLKGLITDVIRRNDEENMIIVNVTMLEQHLEFPVSAGELKKITE